MEHTFLRELDAMHEVAVRYEDEETRAMAASLIPADTLRARVKAIDPSPEHAQDLLLIELLKWFKEEFFSWHDQPTCETCKTLTYHQGLVPPTVEEMRYLAQRVESYFCPGCKKSYRFPRYNCPRKLMETRSGRCGEWANVFTLCCLALGFDARYIYDVTDHVWTEVWSDFLRRWVHCDACEAEIDKPLLYELGWGKKLRYVIAFSAYETADVTWRYVWDFDKTLQVRKTIKESDLIQYQEERTRKYQEGMDAETKLKHARRRVRELTDFLTPSRIDAQGRSYGGRVSGNLEWRLARRETMTGNPITNKNPDIKELELTYTCSKDEYTKRENGGDDCTKIGWAAYMTTIVDIHRKVEKDWKMTYLARTPGSDVGMFEYTFALTKPCRSLTIYFKTEVFHSGQAIINVIADGTTICVKNNELTAALDGAKEIRVACELSGGNGNTAWQHAQAFRQLVDDKTPMLRIILRF